MQRNPAGQTAELSQLTSRVLLVRIMTELLAQGEQLTAIEDAVAAANTALASLKADIATEIQQVIDALNSNADVATAIAGLNDITAQLNAESSALKADDSPTP